eukprot:1082852-Amphidinium_carterae.1
MVIGAMHSRFGINQVSLSTFFKQLGIEQCVIVMWRMFVKRVLHWGDFDGGALLALDFCFAGSDSEFESGILRSTDFNYTCSRMDDFGHTSNWLMRFTRKGSTSAFYAQNLLWI